MRLKSIIALLLVVMMCVPAFAGCAKSGSADDSAETSVSTQENASSEDTAKDDADKIADSSPDKTDVSQSDTPAADEVLFNGNNGVFNILLLGVDNFNDVGISDAILLLSVNKNTQKIKLTSFLRDTYVSIPGYYPHKLNLAYALGGTQLAVDTLESNFGVDIQRTALVNYYTFEDIINIFGGVELELTSEEVSYINNLMEINGETDKITATEGKITLNGKQALCHMRNRGGEIGNNVYAGDDWDRTDRQRKLIAALIERFGSASLTELASIASSVAPYINTDMTKEEMSLLVANFKTFFSYDVESTAVPAEGTWKYNTIDDVGSVIEINDWSIVREDVESFIYE